MPTMEDATVAESIHHILGLKKAFEVDATLHIRLK